MREQFIKWMEQNGNNKGTIDNTISHINKYYDKYLNKHQNDYICPNDLYTMDVLDFETAYEEIIGMDVIKSWEKSSLKKLREFKIFKEKKKNIDLRDISFFKVLTVFSQAIKKGGSDRLEKITTKDVSFIYSIVSALLYNRDKAEKGISAKRNIDALKKEIYYDEENLCETDNAYLYKLKALKNCRDHREDVIEKLGEIINNRINIVNNTTRTTNEVLLLNSVASFAGALINMYKNRDGFENSSVRAHLYLLKNVNKKTVFFNPTGSQANKKAVEMILDFFMLALENQGRPFSENVHLYPKNSDRIFLSVLKPFLKQIDSRGIAGSDEELLQKYAELKIIYPSEDGRTFIISEDMKFDVPLSKEGSEMLQTIRNDPKEAELLKQVLDAVNKMVKKGIKTGILDTSFLDQLRLILASPKINEKFNEVNELAVEILIRCDIYNLLRSETYDEAVKIAEELISVCQHKSLSRIAEAAIKNYLELNDKCIGTKELNYSNINWFLATLHLLIYDENIKKFNESCGNPDIHTKEALLNRCIIACNSAVRFARGSELGGKANLKLAKAYIEMKKIADPNDLPIPFTKNDYLVPALKAFECAMELLKNNKYESKDLKYCKAELEKYFDGSTLKANTKIIENIETATLSGISDGNVKKEIKKIESGGGLQIIIPKELESSSFYNYYYLCDIDSETSARKKYGAIEMEKPVFLTLLSGQNIVLSAPQIIDTNLRNLAEIPQFLELLRSGFVSVSLFSDRKSLKDYVIKSLGNNGFAFSSMPFLTLTGGGFDKAIRECRGYIAACIAGENKEKEIKNIVWELVWPEKSPEEISQEIFQFVEQVRLLDENISSFQRCYHFQNGDSTITADNLLMELLNHYFGAVSEKEPEEYRLHSLIDDTLKARVEKNEKYKYTRSEYKAILDDLKKNKIAEDLVYKRCRKIDLEELFNNKNKNNYIAQMYDILGANYNLARSYNITKHTRSTYKKEFEIPVLDDFTFDGGKKFEAKQYNSFTTIGATGYTVDMYSLVKYLRDIRRIIELGVTASQLEKDLNNHDEHKSILGYQFSDDGLNLVDASIKTTKNDSVRIEIQKRKDAIEDINQETKGV